MGSLPRAAAPAASSAARLRVLWGAARARGLLGQGNAVGAQREAASVVEIWKNVKNPGNAVGPVAPLPMLGRERVVDAVGAATFVLAEQHARQASALRPPRYLGPPTHAGVNDFVQNKVATWARSKQEKIAAAIQGYAKTAKIVPVPPGRWIVLGHTRVGELNAELADEILGLSLPAQLAKDDGEREAFERAMRGSAAPAVGAARAAFESCVRLSEQYRLAAGEHQYCRERLNGLPPAE
jgi:NTP pyrophosphatase (non-canonical NTP hydrolase)